jgi:hypothetical protein
MPRRWKNSDDHTYFVDKAIESRLEKLRCDLIEGYSRKKFNKKGTGQNRSGKKFNNNTPKTNNNK